MGDENPIRTLGDYSKPSHEGYMNTIELPVGNNVVPLRSDTIRLVQNGCSFHGLRSEDPNQHLKDFLKLVDSLDLNGSITTWEDLTTRFLAQFFPPGRTLKLRNDILMFQQHHGESLSEAWTHFLRTYSKNSIIMASTFGSKSKSFMTMSIPSQDEPLTNRPVICTGPHNTQYCMEDPKQAFVKYASSRIDKVGGKWYTFKPEKNNLGDTYNPSWKSHPNLRLRNPQNSQNNFSNPPNRFQPNGPIPNHSFNNRPQSFNNQSKLEGLVSNFMASQYARLFKFEADFKQQQSEMTNKINTVLKAIADQITGALPSDTVKNPKMSTYLVLSARSYPTEDPQCSTHIHGLINAITIHPKQQSESHDEKPKENKEEEKDNLENIHVNPSVPPDPLISFITEKVLKLNSFFKSLGLVPQSSNTELVCTKGDDGDVMFIEIVQKNDDSRKEEPKAGE
ncbi:MAK10-like protein [Tanacetum coccineum]